MNCASAVFTASLSPEYGPWKMLWRYQMSAKATWVATHILAYEGDSKWFWFEGNFASYEENKIERLGIEAARPHRVTHRRLTRD